MIIVMLDGGHGIRQYMKGAKQSPDKTFFEGEYNREIVKLIAAKLRKLQIPYYIVVPEERDIALSTRVTRANAVYKKYNKKAIYISVHSNAAGCGQWMNARGWCAFTSKGQTAGDKLADCMYEAAHEILDPMKIKIREDWSDKDRDWEENFTVIAKTSCPAVLVESFFYDNKEDLAFLKSDFGKKTVVDIYVSGIVKYLKKYDK